MIVSRKTEGERGIVGFCRLNDGSERRVIKDCADHASSGKREEDS